MKKYVLGISCLILAVLLLLQGHFGLPDLDWRIFPMIGSFFFVYHAVKNLVKGHFPVAIFQAFIAFIILNRLFHFVDISVGVLLVAGILISIGLNLLFKPKRRSFIQYSGDYKWKNERTFDDDYLRKDVTFGSAVHYINSENFVSDRAKVAFGNSEVYFDHAVIQGRDAVFHVEVAFGEMTLYVPSNWEVIPHIKSPFGHIEVPIVTREKEKCLILKGDVNFGQLKIVYI